MAPGGKRLMVCIRMGRVQLKLSPLLGQGRVTGFFNRMRATFAGILYNPAVTKDKFQYSLDKQRLKTFGLPSISHSFETFDCNSS